MAETVPKHVNANTIRLTKVLKMFSASILVFDGGPQLFKRFITTFQFAIENNTSMAHASTGSTMRQVQQDQ